MDSAYLKEYSLLPTNYSIQEIWNFIPIAENLHIVPLIGEDKYNELLDQVEHNNVSHDNAQLLLQIYPFESLAIMEVAIPYIAFHITEVGITKHSSDNSESASTDDINYLVNYIRSQMIPTKEKLVKYLKANDLLKPCKCNKNSNAGRIYSFDKINTDVDGNSLYKTYNSVNSIWRI